MVVMAALGLYSIGKKFLTFLKGVYKKVKWAIPCKQWAKYLMQKMSGKRQNGRCSKTTSHLLDI